MTSHSPFAAMGVEPVGFRLRHQHLHANKDSHPCQTPCLAWYPAHCTDFNISVYFRATGWGGRSRVMASANLSRQHLEYNLERCERNWRAGSAKQPGRARLDMEQAAATAGPT